MKEQQRIAGLFSDLYDGNPWLDINIHDTLESILPEIAAKKLKPDANSIWEIANHLISWRENVLERVKGKVLITPNHNYFVPIADPTAQAWKSTLERFEISQQNWLSFLAGFSEKDFGKVYPNNDHTYYEHIHGIIQHDAYHLGQIVMLRKLLAIS